MSDEPKRRVLDDRGFVILDAPDDTNPTPADHNPAAVANCHLCDDDGLRGGFRCTHIDYAAAAARGREKCRQALNQTKIPTRQESK